MKSAFALLVDTTVHNFMRRLAVDINERYRTGFKAAVLPPHISLKQPFQISSLAAVEAYFDQLAQSVEPFEITLTHLELQIVSLDDGEQGVLWLAVREDHALRSLHRRINLELAGRFENTQAPFDGPAYRFHATLAVGGQPVDVYRQIYAEYGPVRANLTYTARELAMYYTEGDSHAAEGFVYKILPLGKEEEAVSSFRSQVHHPNLKP
jgi:2'-5' RNA ligase